MTLDDIENTTNETIAHDRYELPVLKTCGEWLIARASVRYSDADMDNRTPLTVLQHPAEPVSTPAKTAHPEWLESEQDYLDAPAGTICAEGGTFPLAKMSINFKASWHATGITAFRTDSQLAGVRRYVLRWGWGNDD